jgi:hypothetical protein
MVPRMGIWDEPRVVTLKDVARFAFWIDDERSRHGLYLEVTRAQLHYRSEEDAGYTNIGFFEGGSDRPSLHRWHLTCLDLANELLVRASEDAAASMELIEVAGQVLGVRGGPHEVVRISPGQILWGDGDSADRVCTDKRLWTNSTIVALQRLQSIQEQFCPSATEVETKRAQRETSRLLDENARLKSQVRTLEERLREIQEDRWRDYR